MIIYGAGESGRQLLNSLFHGHEYAPVAFVDDDPGLQNLSVGGLRVYAPDQIPQLMETRRGLRLRFVYRRRGPSLLVADGRLNSRGLGVASRSKTGRGRSTVPIFLLVPQVRLKKRLDLAREAERVQGMVPAAIVANWVKGRT